MKIKYFAALAAASLVGFGALHVVIPSQQSVLANPCAANPCAANPCAANPCAANPCAANPCAANPCAANPCAANPCAANPGSKAAELTAAPAIYTDPKAGDNLAVRGFDTVAYFTEGRPVEGSSRFRTIWKGAVWQFSSARNLALFQANPEAYAPQYGGYCAKALSDGALASTVPDAWKIVDGKLYLNYSAQAQREWETDIPGKIASADSKWPQVLTTANAIFYDTGTVRIAR